VIDHIVIGVRDLDAGRAFYLGALGPLGIEIVFDRADVVGFGSHGKPEFWLREEDAPTPVHVAFSAPDRAAVEAFHAAALGAGATDNGGPGVREIYHPTYYGAFVLDPDGHNVEAVIHTAEDSPRPRTS
jgi:catechol 2,3-dioxygenase-like lactoylglutathione lyase family enzyme